MTLKTGRQELGLGLGVRDELEFTVKVRVRVKGAADITQGAE
jgi:hypothetical protein